MASLALARGSASSFFRQLPLARQAPSLLVRAVAPGSGSAAVTQVRFSRDPETGSRGRYNMQERSVQPMHAIPKWGWSWVGDLEENLKRSQRLGAKVARKLRYPMNCP